MHALVQKRAQLRGAAAVEQHDAATCIANVSNSNRASNLVTKKLQRRGGCVGQMAIHELQECGGFVSAARGGGAVDQGKPQHDAAGKGERRLLGGKLALTVSVHRRRSQRFLAAFQIRAIFSIENLAKQQ